MKDHLFCLWIVLFWAFNAYGQPAEISFSGDEDEDDFMEETEEIHILSQGEQDYWKAIDILDNSDDLSLAEGRTLLEKAAQEEFTHAQNFIAGCYLAGSYGFKKSKRKAVEYFQFSADRGNAYAQVNLGRAYLYGIGVWKNKKKALLWLEKATETQADYSAPQPPEWLQQKWKEKREALDSDDMHIAIDQTPPEIAAKLHAHYLLGMIYHEMDQMTESHEQVIQAAYAGPNGEYGLSDAARIAAINLAFGQGVDRDLEKAQTFLERRKELSLEETSIFAHGLSDRIVISRFLQAEIEAEMQEKISEDQTKLQYQIALNLDNEKGDMFNPEEAVTWYELAAEGEQPWAMLRLAYLYAGDKLGEPEMNKAAYWFKKAGDQSDGFFGSVQYALCLYHGYGVEQDQETAMELFKDHADENIIAYLATKGEIEENIPTIEEETNILKRWAEKEKDPHAQYLYGYRFFAGFGLKQSFNQANKWFKKAIKTNDHPKAHYYLGLAQEYALGIIFASNNKARDHYIKALQGGEAKAAFRLSVLADYNHTTTALYILYDGPTSSSPKEQKRYFLQKTVQLDPEYSAAWNNLGVFYSELAEDFATNKSSKAFITYRDEMLNCFQKGIELDIAIAYYNLGRQQYKGDILEQNYAEAYKNMLLAVEKGHDYAHLYLARMLLNGKGVSASSEEAMHHYRLVALGDTARADRIEALDVLANHYLENSSSSDLDAAEYWLDLSAKWGNSDSLLKFGDLLLDTERYTEARKYFQGLWLREKTIRAHAQFRLYQIYKNGWGVEINEKKAEKYLSKSLKKDCPLAIVEMGMQALDTQNYAEALEWYQRAHDMEFAEATYQIGKMYLQGEGVSQDAFTAYVRFKEAAKKDYIPAMIALAQAALEEAPEAPSLEEGLRYAQEAKEHGDEAAEALINQLKEKLGIESESEEPVRGSGDLDVASNPNPFFKRILFKNAA